MSPGVSDCIVYSSSSFLWRRHYVLSQENIIVLRYELKEKCETQVDQTCGLVTTEVPEQICKENVRNRYIASTPEKEDLSMKLIDL